MPSAGSRAGFQGFDPGLQAILAGLQNFLAGLQGFGVSFQSLRASLEARETRFPTVEPQTTSMRDHEPPPVRPAVER
jgi:hypothetical protein